jgi:uncharacterized membrane protein
MRPARCFFACGTHAQTACAGLHEGSTGVKIDPKHTRAHADGLRAASNSTRRPAMADAPLDVIVAAYNDQEGAKKALGQLREAQKEKVIAIKDAAVIWKDKDSKLHVSETGDMTGTRGAAYGGVAGAVLGVIAGPVGWAALGGAAIGGLVAKLRDSGFDNKRLEALGANLTPGSSAIVAVIEHTWVTEIEKILVETAKDVVTMAVGDEIAAQLEAEGGSKTPA